MPSAVNRGHVARCRALIEELCARGHECRAAMLGRRAARLVADLCPVDVPDERLPAAAVVGSAPPAFLAVRDFEMSLSLHTRDDATTAAIVEFLVAVVDRVRPEAVIADQVVYAGPVARAAGVPVVQVTNGPYFPGRGTWLAAGADDPRVRVPPALPRVAAVLARAGLPEPGSLDELLDGEALLAPTVPALGTAAGAVHYDAPGVLPGADRHPQLRRRPGRPLVAVSLGTAHRAYEDVLDGVLAAGADPVVVDSERLPGGSEIAAARGVQALGVVDVGAVFADADAVVHHGGAGTTLDAVRAGRPAIAVPTQGEQELNGRYLERAGAGRVVPVSPLPLEPLSVGPGLVALGHREPHDVAPRVRAALEELLAGACDEGVRAAREEVLALPGPEVAAEVVERVASQAAAR